MITPDTTIAVAAALPWHQAHDAARSALPHGKVPIAAHVATETYSVLTRLPRPRRLSGTQAWDYLRRSFLFPPAVLSAGGYEGLLELAAEKRIAGGAIYDAVVAAEARESGARLLTLDRRAVPTYELLRVDYRLI